MIDKEKMKTGWYYSQEKHGAEICHWDSDHEKWDSIFGSDEVLAPVPSYQEYLALESDSLAKKEAEEIIAELEAENAKLKTEYEKECHRADELEDSYWKAEKENQKLKELLKECKNEFRYLRKHCDSRWKNNPLLEERIDEALK